MGTIPDAETTTQLLTTMQSQQGKDILSIQVKIPKIAVIFLPVKAARYWTDIHNIVRSVQLVAMAKQWLLSQDLKWNDEVHSLPQLCNVQD
jgi:hypothetical protein